jgi:hypothetical protein
MLNRATAEAEKYRMEKLAEANRWIHCGSSEHIGKDNTVVETD